MKKISILLAVLLLQTILVVPSLASSGSVDVTASAGGYIETVYTLDASGADAYTSTWKALTELKVRPGSMVTKAGNASSYNKESLALLQFVIPEFTGTVTKADMTLNFTNISANIPKGDVLEIYKVYQNNWTDGINNPTRNSDGTYTPEIDSSSQVPYPLAVSADFVSANQAITIDLRSIIRHPGTYSLALKRIDNTADLRIDFATKKPVIHVEYATDATPAAKGAATVSQIISKEDGFFYGATWTGFDAASNYQALILKNSNLSLLQFEVPEFHGNVTSAKLNLCYQSALAAGTYNITVHKGDSSSWDERTNIPVKNADGTYTPGISTESYGSITLTGGAQNSYVEIPINGLIDKPGKYTIALKSDSDVPAMFYSNDGNARLRWQPSLTFTYEPDDIVIKTNSISKDINNTTKVENISSLSKDEQIYQTVNLENYTGESNTVAIIAQYNGDRMVECTFMPILPDNNWFEKAVQTTTYKEGVTKIKAFIWRDLSAMKSEATPITVE